MDNQTLPSEPNAPSAVKYGGPGFWTEDRLNILVPRWESGCSALEIAKEIGTTKNAIIGKIDRLKLKRTVATGQFWTQEQVATLTRLWLEGYSARHISEVIHRRGRAGPNITRGSVISKAHNLGLKPRARTRGTGNKSELSGVDPTLHEGPAPQGFLSVLFENLEGWQCRYPRGGGEKPIVFCGKPKMKTSAYCFECHSRCYSH